MTVTKFPTKVERFATNMDYLNADLSSVVSENIDYRLVSVQVTPVPASNAVSVLAVFLRRDWA